MSSPIRISPEGELRSRAQRAFARTTAAIADALPDAETEHIGATSVPGALTKGDLDVLVRVPPDRFADAVGALGDDYAAHYREGWTPTYASFTESPERELPVGLQLVVAGGSEDLLFVAWRERLRSEPELLERFNSLKAQLDGEDYESYTDAKGAFIEAELGGAA